MSRPYWIAFGDIHGNCGRIASIPGLKEAAGVIVTGDMTSGGGVGKAAHVLSCITAVNAALMAQVGNADRPEVTGMLEEKGWNIHARSREIWPGVVLMGLGGSPPTPFGTPGEYPEARLAGWLETTWRNLPPHKQLIVVSHAPPYNTACDMLRDGITHAGSKALRAFLDKAQPALCLCGHIHEARATDRLGDALVLNPGAFVSGGYMFITLESGCVRAEIRRLPE